MVPAAFLVILLFLATDKYFYKPFRDAETIKVVIASFGMMLIIRSAVQVLWGPNQITFVPGIAKPNATLQSLSSDIGMMILMPNKHLFIFAGTILLIMYIIYKMLERARISPWGSMMTAIR